jgi:hypothetical protein
MTNGNLYLQEQKIVGCENPLLATGHPASTPHGGAYTWQCSSC